MHINIADHDTVGSLYIGTHGCNAGYDDTQGNAALAVTGEAAEATKDRQCDIFK